MQAARAAKLAQDDPSPATPVATSTPSGQDDSGDKNADAEVAENKKSVQVVNLCFLYYATQPSTNFDYVASFCIDYVVYIPFSVACDQVSAC